jgi:hypothetical protein
MAHVRFTHDRTYWLHVATLACYFVACYIPLVLVLPEIHALWKQLLLLLVTPIAAAMTGIIRLRETIRQHAMQKMMTKLYEAKSKQ